MRTNPEVPGHQAEIFLLGAAGPWLEAASTALALLPQASKQLASVHDHGVCICWTWYSQAFMLQLPEDTRARSSPW